MIKEEIMKLNEDETAKWGFDLTQFKPGGFQKVLQALSIKPSPVKGSYGEWEWKGNNILIATANNPITGKYYSGGRPDEKDYASYIGIEGDAKAVKKAVSLINKFADYIKGESKNTRDFI